MDSNTADSQALVAWRERLREDAKNPVAGERQGYPWISIRGKEFWLAKTKMNPPFEVVVLDAANDYSFYEDEFDAMDQGRTPDCFAIGRNLQMVPHLTAPRPQSETCDACPHDRYGSADNGKAKRCRQRIRLALMTLNNGSIASLRIPPTSRDNWGQYVRRMKLEGLPPYAAVVRVGFDANSVFAKITFEFARHIDTEKEVHAIQAARKTVVEALLVPPQIKTAVVDKQDQEDREIPF
jgi:hypothetical protein